jgi:hypothetical protein
MARSSRRSLRSPASWSCVVVTVPEHQCAGQSRLHVDWMPCVRIVIRGLEVEGAADRIDQ